VLLPCIGAGLQFYNLNIIALRVYKANILCCFLLSSALFFSCCQKPVEVIVDPPVVIPPDLKIEQVQFLPYGGDPRGTYYPNTPAVFVTGYETAALELIHAKVNQGSGKLILEGTTSMSGTWKTQDFVLQFDGGLKLNRSPYPISDVNHDSLSKFFQQGSGLWDIVRGNEIWFTNRTTVLGFPYTKDTLGMYFYTSPPRITYPPDANTLLLTTIFKKQR
jgi:hypothetical protein